MPRPAITFKTCSRRSTNTARRKGPLFALALSALVCAPAVASRPLPPAVGVDAILAAYDRATHLGAIESIETSGTLTGEGLTGTFHSWRSGDREVDVESLGPRSETTLRIGERMWVRNGNGNVRELRGFLLRRSLTARFVESGAFVRDPDRSRFLGFGTIDGRRAWRIEVAADGGEPETLWIDADSGLLLRTEFVDGDGPTYVDLSDWRDVGGARIAFAALTTDGTHAYDLVERTTSIAIGRPIDPARFAPLQARTLQAAGVQEVPLVTVGSHVGCTVTIAGRAYTFLIDSGAQNVLVDSRVAKEAGLAEEGDLEVRGAVRTGGLRVAKLARLKIGTAALDDLVVSTIDLGSGAFRVEGILGYPFFASALVQLDFPRNVLRFGPPGSFAPPGERVDLDVDREIPESTLRINDRVDAPFIIDTGNSGDLLLYAPFINAHPGMIAAGGSTSVNYGVGGSDRTYRTTVDSLRWGSTVLANQPGQVVLASSGAFADRIDAGNIGLGILRKYVVTFDLANGALYLYRAPVTTS